MFSFSRDNGIKSGRRWDKETKETVSDYAYDGQKTGH